MQTHNWERAHTIRRIIRGIRGKQARQLLQLHKHMRPHALSTHPPNTTWIHTNRYLRAVSCTILEPRVQMKTGMPEKIQTHLKQTGHMRVTETKSRQFSHWFCCNVIIKKSSTGKKTINDIICILVFKIFRRNASKLNPSVWVSLNFGLNQS